MNLFPATHQGDIVQIDAVDDLPKKNLITYSLYNRLLEQQSRGTTSWLDVVLAQSYHVGETPTSTRDFFFTGTPLFGSIESTASARRCPSIPINFPICGLGPSSVIRWARFGW